MSLQSENRMGTFICELRKEKGLTQKQLAEQLSVTDKAISKWERGMGYPDITLLTKLADCLGVSTNELLRGIQETVQPEPEPREAIVQYTLEYVDSVTTDKRARLRKVVSIIFSAALLTAAVICMICDLAISGRFTWAVYPISSLLFSWLVVMPPLCLPRQHFFTMLLSVSIFVLPYLLVLNQAVGGDWFIPIAVPCTLASLAWAWVVYLTAATSKSGWYAAAVAFLCTLPLDLCIDFSVASYTHTPALNGWTLVEVVICLVAAAVLFSVGKLRRHTGAKAY